MADQADVERVRIALEQGDRRADAVLEFRKSQLVRREQALARMPADEVRLRAAPPVAADAFEAAGPAARGVLVAEGDSWFDYPLTDVLRILEDHFGYDVESVAHKGDRIENMAYTDGQLEELTRTIEKLLRRQVVPQAILLSGGGNDVAGAEFGMLLNHKASPVPGLNARMLDGLLNERIRLAYISILRAVTRLCQAKIQRTIPIVLHGYDRPVPDGRGFLGGWWFLPGPWLEPGFREKGYGDGAPLDHLQERIDLAGALLDRFNEMLQSIVAMPEFSHVRYVDLRGTLSNAIATYRQSWANELHPTPSGFELVAARLAAKL